MRQIPIKNQHLANEEIRCKTIGRNLENGGPPFLSKRPMSALWGHPGDSSRNMIEILRQSRNWGPTLYEIFEADFKKKRYALVNIITKRLLLCMP